MAVRHGVVTLTGTIRPGPGDDQDLLLLVLRPIWDIDGVIDVVNRLGQVPATITLLPGGLDPAAGDAGRDDADEQLPLPGGPGLDARPFGRFPFVLGHVMGWPLDQHAPPLAPG